MALDLFCLHGDVDDVLEDCDRLATGLGRLRRQGKLSEQEWVSSTERLAEIRAGIEAHLTGE